NSLHGFVYRDAATYAPIDEFSVEDMVWHHPRQLKLATRILQNDTCVDTSHDSGLTAVRIRLRAGTSSKQIPELSTCSLSPFEKLPSLGQLPGNVLQAKKRRDCRWNCCRFEYNVRARAADYPTRQEAVSRIRAPGLLVFKVGSIALVRKDIAM